MNPMNRFGIPQPAVVSNPTAERAFITKVYGWMALALAITGMVAIATAANIENVLPLLQGPGLLVMFGLQIGTVLVLSFAINKLSAGVATGLFVLYAALTGFTLSTLFFVYTASSIASTFFITSATFAVVSAYGYVTKTDLTKLGNLLLMGLIGIIIASLVNFFLQSEAVMWAVTYIGVVIFVGLIAYDTQRIKRMANGLGEDGDVQRKAAVIGALALYLDFINLFLRLLRIMGRRR
jgi:uncharacterized protein